ncbi:alpha/beta hydrolase [Filobacillus milosensis]|uniref:Alpha/beta hydrolase n=1 Tax=Filobacillus milosensis TaxID=94137 RepID=A0A4Y8INF8_9BACI|nr:alpha/beta hydrolase [Filobacillus milosensis]TFB22869.1 alpha/beta hydrolase [Filobacillus milosensis]
MTTQTYTQNGISYTYNFIDSHKETVVLAHGAGMNQATWKPLLSYLSEYNLLTFDFRGHGESDGFEFDVSWQVFHKDFRGLLHELSINEYHYIGHGHGFFFILDYITSYQPANIQSIVSLSTPGSYPKNVAKKGVRLRKSLAEEHGYSFLVDEMIKQFIHQQSSRHVDLLKKSFHQLNPENYFKLLDLNTSNFSYDNLLSINEPVLLLSGELDQNYPPQLNFISTNYFTTSKYYIIPDASNMVHLDQPQETARLIKKFIRQLSNHSGSTITVPKHFDELQQSIQSVLKDGMSKIDNNYSLKLNLLNGFMAIYKNEKLEGKWNQRKAKNIMAYLAINQTVTRENLCDLFWPDLTVTNGLKNVRVAINHLKKIFEENDLSTHNFLEIETDRISLATNIDCDVKDLIDQLNFIEKESNLNMKLIKYERVIKELNFPLFEGLYDEWLLSVRESIENRLRNILLYMIDHADEAGHSESKDEYKLLLEQLN